MMNSKTRKKLNAAGYKIGDADEFLGLTATESKFVREKTTGLTVTQSAANAIQTTSEQVRALLDGTTDAKAQRKMRDVLDLLAAGIQETRILEDYPDLQPEDIRACLQYAASHVSVGTCRSPDLKKSNPKRLINCWPGDLLREEFMKPLGLSAATIAAAMPRRVYPKGPVLTPAYWESRIKVLIGELDDFEAGPDPLLFAALERYFRLSSGYFMRVWCAAANRGVSKTHAKVLERIKPLNSAKAAGFRTVGHDALPPTRPKLAPRRR